MIAKIDSWWRNFEGKTDQISAVFAQKTQWDLPEWMEQHLGAIDSPCAGSLARPCAVPGIGWSSRRNPCIRRRSLRERTEVAVPRGEAEPPRFFGLVRMNETVNALIGSIRDQLPPSPHCEWIETAEWTIWELKPREADAYSGQLDLRESNEPGNVYRPAKFPNARGFSFMTAIWPRNGWGFMMTRHRHRRR